MSSGLDLGDILYARGSLTEPDVRYFGKQAAADVRPQNLILTDAMTTKLRDLGFAEDVEECNYWKKPGTTPFKTQPSSFIEGKRKHEETNKGQDNDDSDHEGKKACVKDMATEQQGKLLELYREVPEEEDRVIVETLTLTSHEEFPHEKVIQSVPTQEDLTQMEIVQEGEATATE
ncbi:hypothetical protein EC957_009007 [Mortierella hygrophila]|uniref:Uncharacterized protein n=1 Tax=Mortierella hygrophila TaxID=979708 RepID=A0A9P6K598_9FUNG|nr:hypothetical protein EC957_009007 [Mortierella hygrophila]